MLKKIRVLVVGCGNMGVSHAKAYHKIPEYEIVGLVSRKPESRQALNLELGGKLSCYHSFDEALTDTKPDAVSINTYPDTHAEYAIKSLKAGAHVFVEKPLALTVAQANIVDCGVHYVDVMCQMTEAKPISVNAIGAKLTDEIAKDMYNYGHLQVTFADGSVGWYEAGWGHMISETAFFVKDVFGPKGSVSIIEKSNHSDDIDSHTSTNSLKLHSSQLGADRKFIKNDEIINTESEPNHQELCDLEQAFFLKAIKEDIDLTDHIEDAVNSLKIVLAADKAFRTGKTVFLDE